MILWKESIPGYEISNTGLIRSMDRKVKHSRLKYQFIAGRELKIQKDKDGYQTVGLRINGKMKICKIHRLVANAFIENTSQLPMINHLNSKRDDNRVENLEWTNNSGNQKHAFENGRCSKGENHSQHILKENDIPYIMCEVLNGRSQRQVSLSRGLSPGTVNTIMTGKTWSHVTAMLVPKLIQATIEYLEQEKFPCRENAIAITKLDEALLWLAKRTSDREKRGVEGQNKA